MAEAAVKVTIEERMLEGINDIDLSMIRMKLMDPEEGAGWTQSFCDRVEPEYRRYLGLTRRYSDLPIVPSKYVDTFWHFHILDTQAYAADCANHFGYFLHHYPYFGMRGEDDAQALGNAYDETLRLYEHHFGTPDSEIWVRDGMSRCPNCGRRCNAG